MASGHSDRRSSPSRCGRRAGEADGDYPRDLLRFYRVVYELTRAGRRVDVGDLSMLGPDAPGLLGRPDFVGVLYTPSQSFRAVPPTTPALTAVIVTGNELEVAGNTGISA